MLRLKVIYEKQSILLSPNDSIRVKEFKEIIKEKFNILPKNQIFTIGYPPTKAKLVDDDIIKKYFKSGDKIVVEESYKSKMIHVEMPSDNSWCDFLLDKNASISDLRQLIAATIVSDPDLYSEAYLGESSKKYCSNILADNTWGAIELMIFALHYDIEIFAFNIQENRPIIFNNGQTSRVFLLYSGIHYDAISDSSGITKFSALDSDVYSEVCNLVNELHTSKQFTDFAKFQLRCLICKIGLKGQAEASSHAKITNHMSFEEF